MFDDTQTFASIDIQQFDDPYALHNPYLISEDSSGTWPWTPIDGDVWQEAALNGPEEQALAALTHPSPVALLTAAGEIYIWQFDHSPSSDPEAYVAPYAVVAPGTQTIDLLFRDYRANGLWALEPDGTEVVLMDSNPADIASSSLMPIDRPIGFPMQHSTKPPPGGELGYFAVNNKLIKLL
jgi:hypothetical protein